MRTTPEKEDKKDSRGVFDFSLNYATAPKYISRSALFTAFSRARALCDALFLRSQKLNFKSIFFFKEVRINVYEISSMSGGACN